MVYVNLAEWWRVLEIPVNPRAKALKILTECYVRESRRFVRFSQHADWMEHPDFRDKLLAIAADKAKYVARIAEQIEILGGRVPDLPITSETRKTSHQHLLEDLNEEQISAGELIEQASSIHDQAPVAAEILRQLEAENGKHREALRELLVRSDAQSQ